MNQQAKESAHPSAKTSEYGLCARCGRTTAGRRQWMFYRWYERFPKSPITRQFFCQRCNRIMQLHGIIALAVLILVTAAIVIVAIGLSRFTDFFG